MVTVPKLKGGLGVKDIYIQNEALLIKHLVKFYNKADVPWVQLIWSAYYQNNVPHLSTAKGSFWWKDILKLFQKFSQIATCIPSMGDSVGVWKDKFRVDIFSLQFPHLFTYVYNKNLSLKELLQVQDILSIFRLPMSRAAYNEFLVFSNLLDDLRAEVDETDVWICHWSRGLFSSSRLYKHNFNDLVPTVPLIWIWKAKCEPRIKFFMWLLLVDRLNTRAMLRKRHKYLEKVISVHFAQVNMRKLHFIYSFSVPQV